MSIGKTSMICAIVCVVASTGCSVLMSRVDTHRPASRAPSCSDSRLAPNLDSLGTISSLAMMVAFVSATGGDNNNTGPGSIVLAIPAAAAGIILGASAVYGYGVASKCIEENQKWNDWKGQPLEERLVDVRILKKSQFLDALGKKMRLHIEASRQVESSILMTASSAATCISLDWRTVLRGNREALAREGITHAECSYHHFAVWSGRISSLPESVYDTACGALLGEAIWTSEQKHRKALVAAMPEACRYGAKAFEWVNQAIGAALTGQCASARSFIDRVRRVDPRYYQEKLAQRPEMQRCLKGL